MERALSQDVTSFGHLYMPRVSDMYLSAVDRATCVPMWNVEGEGLQTALPQHWGQTSDVFTLFGVSTCMGCLSPIPHSPALGDGQDPAGTLGSGVSLCRVHPQHSEMGDLPKATLSFPLFPSWHVHSSTLEFARLSVPTWHLSCPHLCSPALPQVTHSDFAGLFPNHSVPAFVSAPPTPFKTKLEQNAFVRLGSGQG